MEGMKKQMVMMVPQMVIMGWINFFFQGFVLSKSYKIHNFLNLHDFLTSRWSISQASIPLDARVQVDDATRDRDAGYGCPMGVVPLMVLS